jgi:hypothetical protein
MKLISRLSLGAMVVLSAGCMRWEYMPMRTAPDNAPNSLGTVRVTLLETGATMMLRDVEVTADSVIGWTTGPAEDRVALHHRELFLERSRTNLWATAGVIVLTLLVAYGAVMAYVLSTIQV